MKHLNPQHFNNNQLKEVADPTQNSDAATKGYVDAGQRIYFGVCNTAGNVADKVVTAPGYTPAEGKILVVKFNDAVRCFDAITQTWIHLTMNVNNTGALYLETYTYDYEYPDGDTRWYDLLDGEFYAAFQYYEISTEDKGYRLIGTTGTFEMIQNLFDRLNSHSQILSDLEQPAPIFYGITNTAEATATKAVTLTNPSDGFVNGSFLLLHFTYAVPAGSDNAISVDGVSYGLTYHQYGVTSSGVVNAGDKVLLYCYNYVAHIVAIDRWGADIQGNGAHCCHRQVGRGHTREAGRAAGYHHAQCGRLDARSADADVHRADAPPCGYGSRNERVDFDCGCPQQFRECNHG